MFLVMFGYTNATTTEFVCFLRDFCLLFICFLRLERSCSAIEAPADALEALLGALLLIGGDFPSGSVAIGRS